VRPSSLPLWLRDPDAPFWFDYRADSRTLYVQYNQIADGEKESAAAFFDRVAAFAAARPVERFVLDLRLNGGGDNTLNPAVVRTILRSAKLSRPERFFTLIGPQTFSAAQNLVNELERYTGTIFVGEPTGSRPNMYGDAVPITLPRSGFTVYISTLWWQDVDPRDRRQWTAPAVAAEISAEDFRRGRDPALVAALAYRPGSSLTGSMRAALSRGDIVGAIDRYRVYRADSVHRYVDTEPELEAFAISLAREGEVAHAVALVELNAREHPRSAQAQYILGEAYRRGGDPVHAAEAFERALALDPRHAGAHHGLRELRGS
jgi:tetratricopeptide (TPR) repeat protein